MRSLILILLAAFISCEKPADTSKQPIVIKSPGVNERPRQEPREEILSSMPDSTQFIMGYRWVINGDFDGDGKKETLTERYISQFDNKETNKWYDTSVNYDLVYELTISKKPSVFIKASTKAIDSLIIDKGPQVYGLSILVNEGDLNGDGRDEVGYLVDWADWSGTNTYHIISYTEKGWKEIYSFDARDWYAPELPEISPAYWKKPVYVNPDTVKNFERVVRKIKNGRIAVKGFNKGGAQVIDTVKLPGVKF